MQSSEISVDSSRVAAVSRHRPPGVRAALRTHITTIQTDYQRFRTIVSDILTSGLEYNSAGVISNTPSTTMSTALSTGKREGKKGKGYKGKGNKGNGINGKGKHDKGKGEGDKGARSECQGQCATCGARLAVLKNKLVLCLL